VAFRLSGGSQVKAQARMSGCIRWLRQGVEWQGMRKATVISVVAGVEEATVFEVDVDKGR
jgi:hypothetical protein